MAKTRLNMSHRDELKSLAHIKVTLPEQESIVAQKHRHAQKITFAEVRKQFPQADLNVLSKYDLTQPVRHISILARSKESGNHEFTELNFDDEFEHIYDGNCYSSSTDKSYLRVEYNGDIHKAIQEYKVALKDYNEALHQKRAD